MVTLVERIAKLLLSEKGRDVHRVVMLLVVFYIAWRVTEVEKLVQNHLGFHDGQKIRLSSAAKP
jgi:hypothetical protein